MSLLLCELATVLCCLQCAVRCHFAKKKADKRRNIVCKAVLLQSAWRSFVAKKHFVMLKQAAILLQAHWRGQSARKRFALLLEENQKRQQEKLVRIAEKRREEEEALKREEIMKAEALRIERDEVKKQGESLFVLLVHA